jgi:hypothetical protein
MVVEKASNRDSLSGRVPRRVLGSSQIHDDNGGGLQYVLWKRDPSPRFFLLRGTYRRKGSSRGWTREGHPLVARARCRPCHPRVWPDPGPPLSHLRSS